MNFGLLIKNSDGDIKMDPSTHLLRVHTEGSMTFSNVLTSQQTHTFEALPYVPRVHLEYSAVPFGGVWSTVTKNSITIHIAAAFTYSHVVSYHILRR